MANVYDIVGAASAQLPLRVLNLFAQQDILPSRVLITCDADRCRLRIEEDMLDPARSTIVAEKMRAMALVSHVDHAVLQRGPSPRSACSCRSERRGG